MNKPGGRGRRSGKPDTRAAVLAVARRRFIAEGYQAVTLRSVAAEAGVDVALISYFFGSKRGLFAAAMNLAVNPAEAMRAALAGDRNGLPQRLLRAILTVWDDESTGLPLQTLLRAASQDPAIAGMVRSVLEIELIDVVAAHLGGRDARRRAAGVNALVMGILYARYIIAVQPIASMTVDEIVRTLTPAMAALLGPNGDAGDPRSRP